MQRFKVLYNNYSKQPNIVTDAKKYSRIDHRSLTGQIEHWAKIGKSAEENSELTYSQIKEILIGVAELDNGEKTLKRLTLWTNRVLNA